MSSVIHTGDALDVLRTLPSSSVHCCVTSPPYYGLRDYGHTGQLGLEPSPEAYVARLVEVFREVRRVLRPDGTLWLNIGDSYCNDAKGKRGTDKSTLTGNGGYQAQATPPGMQKLYRRSAYGLKRKDLMMIPARVAIALQEDGWYLRSDVVWSKPNAMPENVRDRPTCSHEHVFLLSPRPRYFYDAEAVKEAPAPSSVRRAGTSSAVVRSAPASKAADYAAATQQNPTGPSSARVVRDYTAYAEGRNQRSVWSIPTRAYPGAHFAVMPPALVEPCVLAGTSARGVCSSCGAPWTRIVERTAMVVSRSGRAERTGNRTGASGTMVSPPLARTVGWKPGCHCTDVAEPVAATVLDPFAGAGTTGVVALELGRAFVGVEISPEYAALAEARIWASSPLFAAV